MKDGRSIRKADLEAIMGTETCRTDRKGRSKSRRQRLPIEKRSQMLITMITDKIS